MPNVTTGASPNAIITTSDAWDDGVDLVGQVWPNTNYTKDLVADDIAIPIQFDLVIESRDHGDSYL